MEVFSLPIVRIMMAPFISLSPVVDAVTADPHYWNLLNLTQRHVTFSWVNFLQLIQILAELYGWKA